MRCSPLAFVLGLACAPGGSDTGGLSGDGADGADGASGAAPTLDTCAESLPDDLPAFYRDHFACVDGTVEGGDVALWTDGLPPHASPYYGPDDPNWVAFDDRGGTHRQNPNVLAAADFTLVIPSEPVPKGLTIDAALVDNAMNTSDEEYGPGPQGLSLNGVFAFAAMAAPGADLADERFTFDRYEGHPAGTQYHYHFETPGPLEVLVDRGLSADSTPGAGALEIYAVFCDGTVVLGCTELDGSAPDGADFDAQNGHVHDLTYGTTTAFSARYHTHVCPSLFPDYPYFPEIAYYAQGTCPAAGPP